MAGIGLAMLLDVCCGSARRRSSIPLDGQIEARTHGHGMPHEDGVDVKVQRTVPGIIGDMEQGLAAVERTFSGDGENSSRVRENNRKELANDHPEVPASALDKAWMEVGGEGIERQKEKEAIVNESRAGRYKKKRFV